MAFNIPTIDVNIRGTNVVLNKLRAKSKRLSEAQRMANNRIGDRLVREAKAIIKSNAPNTSQRLHNSIVKQTSYHTNNWKTVVTSTMPYAQKVESGHPRETISVTPALLQWAALVNPNVHEAYQRAQQRGRPVTVRVPGRNPFYDTRLGMQFFQIPANRIRPDIREYHMNEVRKVLNR